MAAATSAVRSSTPTTPLMGYCCANTRTASAARSGCSKSSVSSPAGFRSEEHTSELQSQSNLVCRLLLEKKTSLVARRTGARAAPDARVRAAHAHRVARPGVGRRGRARAGRGVLRVAHARAVQRGPGDRPRRRRAAACRRYPMHDLTLYRRVLRQTRPYWWHIAGLLGLGVLASPIAILNPVPLKIVVDSVL